MTITNDKEETLMEKDDIKRFPDKPIEETKQQSINQTLISMALFIGAFYLIFKWDFKYILVLAGVILIHEMGHYLAMRLFKYSDLGIFFIPILGAYASGSKDNISQKQSVIILLSGPLPGVIIGLILYYYGLRDENEFLIRTSNIFIFLNLFNLLPIMPLDGGRIIKSLFFENNQIISRIFVLISIAVLTYYALSSQSYLLLIIPFLLLIQFGTQSQIKKVKTGIIEKGIPLDKSFEELTNEEYWLIRDEIGTHMRAFSRFITPKQYNISVNEQRIIKQVKSIVQKKPTKDLGIVGKILMTTLWISALILPLVAIAIYYIRLGIEIH
jgi:stage IV sporulation protein FB